MALINRNVQETPKAKYSADTTRETSKEWKSFERKNLKVNPPVLDLVKIMCSMISEDKPESKTYALAEKAINEYLANHFSEREQEFIKDSIQTKNKTY